MIPPVPVWPFPPPSGPVPWSAAQVREYEKQKLDDVPDAPF